MAQGQISTIKTWHTIHNIAWKGSAQLRFILNSVDHLTPAHSKKPLHMPINAIMLIQFINALDLTDPLDATFTACAVTAFWGPWWTFSYFQCFHSFVAILY
ncbi:hypothetical protein BYT27DRAFT_7255254 [Phlegmacium glaucopus]|nr:hypothetical protein BYT27DRAFT_7255254 [Phlegmacium glaucopus]